MDTRWIGSNYSLSRVRLHNHREDAERKLDDAACSRYAIAHSGDPTRGRRWARRLLIRRLSHGSA